MQKIHPLKKAATLFIAAFSFSSIIAVAEITPEKITIIDNTYETELDNGLKVIVRADHRAPVVTSMVWYKVGSVDEPRGLGGISHMLEHMMFKGTDTLGPNEHSMIIANLGGRDNAFTSTDYTAYFENLPAWELETALKLEADRMQNLELRAEDFAPERLVVAEERRQRTDSNPQAQLYEAFNANLFTTSAYRNPVIGWMPEIEGWTLEDLANWYQQFYAPNNATVVIVGDVDPEKTIALVEQYFGEIPPSENITRPYNFEVTQQGEKRIDLAIPANMPLLFMGYKVPSINEIDATENQEADALLLASLILDGTSSSRLPKRLVRDEQIALEAGSYYNYGARYTTPFTFVAVPAEGISLAQIEQALKEEIALLQNELTSEEEIERIIGLYEAGNIYSKDSVASQAMLIGQAETTGEGWQNAENRVERLKKVTPEMIRQVAQKYLNEEQATIATLHPQQTTIKNSPAKRDEISNVEISDVETSDRAISDEATPDREIDIKTVESAEENSPSEKSNTQETQETAI